MTSEGDSKWLQKAMKELINYVITAVDEPDEDGFFDIHLRKSANLADPHIKLTPSCDPEGNGPGFLFIEEVE